MDLEKMEIGEAAAYIPGATQLFRQHNIEFCCKGNRPLVDLFREQPTIQRELEALAATPAEQPMLATRDFKTIIEHIVSHFHARHRADFPELLTLSARVEARHADNPLAPKGLHAHLQALFTELELHMQKEESILFPILVNNPSAKPAMPIQVMMAEHDDASHMITGIETMTHQLTPPDGACTSWRALYLNLDRFIFDLKEHISLENNVLFKRALQGEGE